MIAWSGLHKSFEISTLTGFIRIHWKPHSVTESILIETQIRRKLLNLIGIYFDTLCVVEIIQNLLKFHNNYLIKFLDEEISTH